MCVCVCVRVHVCVCERKGKYILVDERETDDAVRGRGEMVREERLKRVRE